MSEQADFVTLEKQVWLSASALEALMRDVLDQGKTFRFQAKGGSMSPFIRNNDLISISPLFSTPPEFGEVVAFTDPKLGKVVVHRIIAKTQDGYLIQGDNQGARTDALISPENILGRVTAVERNGRLIRLGLGPEKFLIALLSSRFLLQPNLARLAILLRPLRKLLS